MLALQTLRHDEHSGRSSSDRTPRRSSVSSWRRTGAPRASKRGRESAKSLRTSCLRGDTSEPFESIECAFREHGCKVWGEDDEQPWDADGPLHGAEIRVEVFPAEARCVERRVPFVNLPGSVRLAKAGNEGAARGWLLGGVVGALQCAGQDSANGGVSCCCRPVLDVAATVDGVTDQLQGGRTCTL